MDQFFFHLAASYYLVCGLSGVFTPHLWFKTARISSNSQSIMLVRFIGGVFFALSIGFFLCPPTPEAQYILCLIALIANITDGIIVGYSYFNKDLPKYSSLGFLLVDIAWCIGFYFHL